jgi:hypothetical protein
MDELSYKFSCLQEEVERMDALPDNDLSFLRGSAICSEESFSSALLIVERKICRE